MQHSCPPGEMWFKSLFCLFNPFASFLVGVLERSLERRTGRSYSPVGNRRMIYFIDDMNMPAVDIYGTVQPHTLIRQHLDYGHWWEEPLVHYLQSPDGKNMGWGGSLFLFLFFSLFFAASRYDRQKLSLKEIHNTQYVACMNPTAGSFNINPRLQVSMECKVSSRNNKELEVP